MTEYSEFESEVYDLEFEAATFIFDTPRLLLSVPAHVRESCRGSSSWLSRHTSRSTTTANILHGWSPKRFHPRSSM